MARAKPATHPDYIYRAMVKHVLKQEHLLKDNRTATKTIGVAGYQAIYPMHAAYDKNDNLVVENFPLLTTKKMYTKGMLAELFWLINGGTNIFFLERNDCHFWTDWPLADYNEEWKHKGIKIARDSFIYHIKYTPGFAEQWGDLGPVYGKQWRAWEAPDGTKIDQVANMLETLKTNPSSRRNIVSAWNPADVPAQRLPPCHVLWQVFVEKSADGKCFVDLLLYQRSMDVLLGAPMNISSYSTLLCMIAKHVKMIPRNFIHQIGDCHIYENHILQLKEQVKRVPFDAPTLTISNDPLQDLLAEPLNNPTLNFEKYAKCIVVSGYESHPALKGEVAV